ncbi:hypothetical protein A3H19_00470 [Candidatus Woesebacteria bacterium RIFCSPLOWO2_12_FULL_39_9]|nr:MAG: hypothetical protein A3H19_00470 [Candidatus Woesebacteria bacterium RIFCSPLOWO2_12_FULL_39_9]
MDPQTLLNVIIILLVAGHMIQDVYHIAGVVKTRTPDGRVPGLYVIASVLNVLGDFLLLLLLITNGEFLIGKVFQLMGIGAL